MKLLVFAHIPPPHHGQSYMVKLMLDGLGGDRRKNPEPESVRPETDIECYHVNCRYSEDLEDIGTLRIEKMWLVLRYCIEAIWCRFRYGVHAFYYVPAPGKRAALYRDWMVMILCRPFFRYFIHHWHASGLGDWLRNDGAFWERWITHRLLGNPSLGLTLAIPGMRDALWFRSKQVEVVANGVPDPCPAFETAVLPRRQQRVAARRALLAGAPAQQGGWPLPSACPQGGTPLDRERCSSGAKDDPAVFRVLYLAHCMREKGLFDAVEGVARANESLRQTNSPLRIHLTVAGLFPFEAEKKEFDERIATPDLASALTYAGFVSGEEKISLLRDSDCLCFPTYYHAESFGLVVVEAMATGMEVIATRWRAIPEILPPDYPGFVPPHAPEAVAAALGKALTFDHAAQLRQEFVARFTETRYLQALREVLSGIRSFSNAGAAS